MSDKLQFVVSTLIDKLKFVEQLVGHFLVRCGSANVIGACELTAKHSDGEEMIDQQQHLLEVFQETGALLEGHFQLSSGLHSPRYLQCALVLQFPEHAEWTCRVLASHFGGEQVGAVVAPAIGGIVVAHETARALGVRAIFTERESGVMTLRRGFNLKNDEAVLVVEDVITTGGSTRETMDAVVRAGGRVVGAGSIVDRSDGAVDLGVPRCSLLTLDVPSYDPAKCPLCRQGIPVTKPGSRGLKRDA